MTISLDRFATSLNSLWKHGDVTVPGLRAGIIKSAEAVFTKYNINTDSLICIIFGQFSAETGCGHDMEESGNYSAARLLQVFPTHFSHSQAIEYAHNSKQVFDHAYGGRMGNANPPSDDGYNYRGRGLSQVTGKNGYAALAKKTGLDLVAHPELIIAPDTALECGVADFILCGCLLYALRGDLVGVSSMLNVGHYTTNTNQINGWHDRVTWTSLWKHAMGVA